MVIIVHMYEKISDITVYRLVRTELQAKLKVARPQNLKQLLGEVEIIKALRFVLCNGRRL